MWIFNSPSFDDTNFKSQAEESFAKLLKRSDLGFKNLESFTESIDDSTQNLERLKHYKYMVIIGLGGSSLGTKALYTALKNQPSEKKLYFLDNVDVTSVNRFLAHVEHPEEWAWLFCSKSGGTIEVTALLDHINEFLKREKGVSLLSNSFVVTEDKPSPLKTLSQDKSLPCFTMPKDVGGRFSVFTPVGLVPMAFLGYDLNSFHRGFADLLNDPTAVVALTSFFLSQRASSSFYSFQYCDDMSHWSLWLQQLWSESLGKSMDRQQQPLASVPTLVPCRGASDQHSVLQQVIEGAESKCVGFHRVKTSEQGENLLSESLFADSLLLGRPLGHLLAAEAEATQQACEQAGIKTFSLTCEELSETAMANLMALWMLTVGALGEAWDLDAFNQPGVESGKVIARRVLQSGH